MSQQSATKASLQAHDWIRRVEVATHAPDLVSGVSGDVAAVSSFVEAVLDAFRRLGHTVVAKPGHRTDIAITTAPFMESVPWRRSLFFTGRIRYRMPKEAAVYTVVPVGSDHLDSILSDISAASISTFDGLAPRSHRVIVDQLRRAGPLVALSRVIQAQAKCIRIVLVVHDGEGTPGSAYLFDLVGAHPRIDLRKGDDAFEEIAVRMATAVSAVEVTDHVWESDPIPAAAWESSPGRRGMVRASRRLGERGFFADPVRIADLVKVPVVGGAISDQYSEGCFSTYDIALGAHIVTGTGSSRAIHKGDISSDDLAVVVGVRDHYRGAVVRPVEGRSRTVPSSEAVELYAIDEPLPRISPGRRGDSGDGLIGSLAGGAGVPVVRSKLHGHCGVTAFDPEAVEHVPVAEAYQRYPVSCGTDAQVRALVDAFSRSEALRNPHDPRAVVFSVLPGHGCVIVEKWIDGLEPLEAIWRLLDSCGLRVDSAAVPQGPYEYISRGSTRVLYEGGGA